jgi:peptidoglycan/LPS O-acetylase OafA/YrhL
MSVTGSSPAHSGTVVAGAAVTNFRARRVVGANGLRACAAMLVLAYHSASLAGATSAGPLAPFAAELKAGVAVFFVISGFLLYLPFARAIGAGRGLPDWRRYAARRAVRILPAYWAALAILTVAGQLHGSAVDLWRYVGLVQIYRGATLEQGLPGAWSLDVEVTFYVALPILAWVAARMAHRSGRSRFEPQVALIVGLGLGSLLLRWMLTGSLIAPVASGRLVLATALPGTIDWFALGMALAVLRAAAEMNADGPRWLTALATRPGLCWMIALALYLVGVPAQGGELFLTAYGVAAHATIGLAAFFLVMPALAPKQATAHGVVMPFLCSGVLAWLGTISYGIYLWHVPFLKVIDAMLGVPRGALAFGGLLAVTTAGAVCLAAASWYLVERPTHRVFAVGSAGGSTALREPAGGAA